MQGIYDDTDQILFMLEATNHTRVAEEIRNHYIIPCEVFISMHVIVGLSPYGCSVEVKNCGIHKGSLAQML